MNSIELLEKTVKDAKSSLDYYKKRRDGFLSDIAKAEAEIGEYSAKIMELEKAVETLKGKNDLNKM